MSNISEAKLRLPLPALMERLGLAEYAKRSARCPFHEDRHASFSIWRTASSAWFFKCHAGCGEGDEINFLELHKQLSRADATKLFLKMAGVNGVAPPAPKVNGTAKLTPNETKPSNGFDWSACVDGFTDADALSLILQRRYSRDFCRWLKENGLIGKYNDCIAFPVHDHAGKVIAAHYRLKDGSWRYCPQGAKMRPLVIGELIAGHPVHVSESYWDAFACMDKSGERSGIVITRGAQNGKLIAGLIPVGATVYGWKQNDELKNGKRAGDEWLKDIAAYAGAKVVWPRTPEQFKDLNDWTRAGAAADDLLAAMMNAELIHDVERRKSQSTEFSETKEPQPFPLHCLPSNCEAMARAVCKTVRVLESLAGCCTLGVLSAAIGRGLQVKSGANRVTRGNLYILISAESGSGKSETFRHAAKPFLDFEAERVATWKAESKPDLLADLKILEEEIAKLKKSAGNANGSTEREEIRAELKEKLAALDNVETKLRTPALSCEDVTGEKLAVLLAHNDEQLASLSADAVAIVNILLGRYNKLDRTDEGIYLKAFSGDRCKVDRQTRESVVLESPCLEALWLTQPDKLESLLAERSLSDGGLIPRLLACHTHCEAQDIVEGAPEIPATVQNDYRDLIRSLIETYRLSNEPFTIEPTAEALETMNMQHNEIVKRRRTDLRDVTIYAARWNEQAWRIAVVLHAAQHGAPAHEYKLEVDTAKRAIEIADWFALQQLEILSASRDKARREIWDEALSLLTDKPQGIRASDVYRARIVRNADEAHALLAAMEANGELSGRDEHPEGGGHVTRIFTRARK